MSLTRSDLADDVNLGSRARQLRLDTLVRLRWLAVVGQTGAVGFVYFVLGFPLPLAPCLLVIAASAWLNLGLRLRFPTNHRLSPGPTFALLSYDILQLSALLFLTGGLDNPFAVLFLAPVMISAVSLSALPTIALGVVTAACATGLMFFHLPLPWGNYVGLSLPFLYSQGIWAAIVVGTAFVGVYAARVADEAQRLYNALSATELILAREQHLSQLDGLAAAAAHELGTPLATITLVVKDLAAHLPETGPAREDIQLLTDEVERCRTILRKIASMGHDELSMLDAATISDLMQEVISPHHGLGVRFEVETHGAHVEPTVARNPAVIYGLGNLVENAADFAKSLVRVRIEWSNEAVGITITDDGPGFSPDLIHHIGEPYITTRESRRSKSEAGSGMGLGLFIAKTLLERSGAAFTAVNVPPPATGAVVRIRWPRKLLEIPREKPSSPGSINPANI